MLTICLAAVELEDDSDCDPNQDPVVCVKIPGPGPAKYAYHDDVKCASIRKGENFIFHRKSAVKAGYLACAICVRKTTPREGEDDGEGEEPGAGGGDHGEGEERKGGGSQDHSELQDRHRGRRSGRRRSRRTRQ